MHKSDSNKQRTENRSVLITEYIGLRGTAVLAEHFKKEIDKRFPLYLSQNAAQYGDGLDVREREAEKIIREFSMADDAQPIVTVGDGGFLTAMWELARLLGTGFELDLRRVPLKQETVEISELLEVNPYYLCSFGSVAAAVFDAELVKQKLESAGIKATIIGAVNTTKAHVLLNDGTVSHLNRPEPDELEKKLKNSQ